MAYTVLVVDHDPLVRRGLELLLESYGFHVALARNARQAISAFQNLDPDVVVADLFMPEPDGVRAIVELRQLSPGVKIVAMSSTDMVGRTDDLALARKLGADALIAKPFEADELIAALHDLLLPDCRITELAFAA